MLLNLALSGKTAEISASKLNELCFVELNLKETILEEPDFVMRHEQSHRNFGVFHDVTHSLIYVQTTHLVSIFAS